jgi:hypothetical protein
MLVQGPPSRLAGNHVSDMFGDGARSGKLRLLHCVKDVVLTDRVAERTGRAAPSEDSYSPPAREWVGRLIRFWFGSTFQLLSGS